jgi:hypothetical protein
MNYYHKDATGEAKLEKDLKKGDGNAVMDDLSKAVNEGKLTQQEAADIGSQVQQYVNGDTNNEITGFLGKTDHIGGKINGKAKQELTDALDGTEVVHGGKTAAAVHAAHFFQGLASTLTFGLVPPPGSNAAPPPATPPSLDSIFGKSSSSSTNDWI